MAALSNHLDAADDDATATASVSYKAEGPSAIVLSLAGEIDISSLPSVRAEIDQIIADTQPRAIAFELSGLTFMDSSGIALLLTIALQVDSVQVRNPSSIVRRVIELSGLESTLPMTL